MLKRKAFERFAFWQQHKTKQALLVSGARQVGKTYLIRKFIQSNYSSSTEFNLVAQDDVRRSFSAATDPNDLMLRISIASETPLIPHETVIFIDEVQEVPEIMAQIKFLVDKEEYDFILSGSLLGLQLENMRSLPVGYATEVKMFPLDFEEFCWAGGLTPEAFPMLRDSFNKREAVPDFLHERLMQLFHRYLLIGGMPDAVNAYLATGTIDQVRVAQTDIIKYYSQDISKYAPKDHRLVIQNIYTLIPSELSGSNKRFTFSSISNIKRFKQITDQFLWLVGAGVAIPAYNVTEPTKPLLISKESSRFKLFMSDVGLLTSTFLKQTTIDLLDGRTGMNMGGVYENVVAQELHSHGFSPYYFSTRKVGELDLLVEHKDGSITAFEIKSGTGYKTHAALDNALGTLNYDITRAYVLAETNVEVSGNVIYLPLYMMALFNYNE